MIWIRAYSMELLTMGTIVIHENSPQQGVLFNTNDKTGCHSARIRFSNKVSMFLSLSLVETVVLISKGNMIDTCHFRVGTRTHLIRKPLSFLQP